MMNLTPRDLIPTQRSLLSRLKNWDDQASWKLFFETYWRLIYATARKSGLNDAEAQDVVQETILSVAKKMPKFKYDPAIGSFKGWLLQTTRWRIQDQFRKKQYAQGDRRFPKEERLGTTLMETHPDSDALDLVEVWEEEWQLNLTQNALARVKSKVSSRHYQMFYLHVCKNLPARQVAERLDVKLPEIYYAKYTVSRQLQKEIKALEDRIL